MAKRGRPRIDLTDEQITQVKVLAGLGLTEEQICLVIGIEERTFRKKKSNNEALNTAYKKGRSEHASRVTKKLWEQIEAGNLTAIIFYLKTQCQWRETSVVETKDVTPDKPQKNRLSNLNVDELKTLRNLVKKTQADK